MNTSEPPEPSEPPELKLTLHDRQVLRELAARQVEIANSPVNLRRRELWYLHDVGQAPRPMILTEWGPAFDLEFDKAVLRCQEKWARELEIGFHRALYQFERIGDDHVIEPYFDIRWQVKISNFGVEAEHIYADNHGDLGARTWEHPIKDIRADFQKLKHRTFTVDREGTLARQQFLQHVFEGLLRVRIRGAHWWSLGMTWTVAELIGLENLMLYMYDDPDGLNQIMSFVRDDQIALAKAMEREKILTPNNGNDYIGSGSYGFTRALVGDEDAVCQSVGTADQWLMLESQETVGVGPQMFAEHILPHQALIAPHFGRCYYGCCEQLHSRIDLVKGLANLKRVSVSPWADQRVMSEALGKEIVYSRKPNPTMISTGHFDESLIRQDLKNTLELTRENNVEIIMKDIHTLQGEAWRVRRWGEIAKECVAQAGDELA